MEHKMMGKTKSINIKSEQSCHYLMNKFYNIIKKNEMPYHSSYFHLYLTIKMTVILLWTYPTKLRSKNDSIQGGGMG